MGKGTNATTEKTKIKEPILRQKKNKDKGANITTEKNKDKGANTTTEKNKDEKEEKRSEKKVISISNTTTATTTTTVGTTNAIALTSVITTLEEPNIKNQQSEPRPRTSSLLVTDRKKRGKDLKIDVSKNVKDVRSAPSSPISSMTSSYQV